MLGRKKEIGEGREEKNTPARYHCSFGKLRSLANGAPDWCCLGEVDWCLSIKCKSILFIPFSFACNWGKELFWIQKRRPQGRFLTVLSKQVFWNWSGCECHVCYAMRESTESNFYTGIRTRFACSAKTLPHFYLISECCLFQCVFFLWLVDYAMESSMFWLSKCDFSRLLNTERSWHAYWFPVVFEFLIGMICPLMQKHFLWPLSKRKALSCGSARLLGPLFLSKVSQDLNN